MPRLICLFFYIVGKWQPAGDAGSRWPQLLDCWSSVWHQTPVWWKHDMHFTDMQRSLNLPGIEDWHEVWRSSEGEKEGGTLGHLKVYTTLLLQNTPPVLWLVGMLWCGLFTTFSRYFCQPACLITHEWSCANAEYFLCCNCILADI